MILAYSMKGMEKKPTLIIFTRLLMLKGRLVASATKPTDTRKGMYTFLGASVSLRIAYIIGVMTTMLPSFEKSAVTMDVRRTIRRKRRFTIPREKAVILIAIYLKNPISSRIKERKIIAIRVIVAFQTMLTT
jgi:hypothetical protein